MEPAVAEKQTTEGESKRRIESSGRPCGCTRHATGHRIDEEHLAVGCAVEGRVSGETSAWTVTRIRQRRRRAAQDHRDGWKCTRNKKRRGGGGEVRTLLGDPPALSAPRSPYATLAPAEADAAQATLGPEQANPEYESRADARALTERHPALLWVALVLVVVLLGVVAVRTAKENEGLEMSLNFDHPATSLAVAVFVGLCGAIVFALLCLHNPPQLSAGGSVLLQSSSRPRSKVSARFFDDSDPRRR